MAATDLHSMRIDRELWRAAVEKTAADGTTVTSVVEAALAAYTGLEAPQRRPGRPRRIDG